MGTAGETYRRVMGECIKRAEKDTTRHLVVQYPIKCWRKDPSIDLEFYVEGRGKLISRVMRSDYVQITGEGSHQGIQGLYDKQENHRQAS